MPWTFLSEGSYNTTYVNDDFTSVLKIQKELRKKDPDEKSYDDPYRSVRIWIQLNPSATKAHVVKTNLGLGWICPYIKGEQASDEEISKALIEIFNRTGRVVVDATIPRNFLRTAEDEIICVDIAQALQMEQLEVDYLQQRRKSVTSLTAWQKLQSKYRQYFAEEIDGFPEAISTIKALLFIKFNRPDILDVSFLQDNPDLLQKLAKAFDQINVREAIQHLYIAVYDGSENISQLPIKQVRNRRSIYKEAWGTHETKITPEKPIETAAQKKESENCVIYAHKSLQVVVPISLEHIKKSCGDTLIHYMKSRGSFDQYGIFKPSFFYRGPSSTTDKVKKTLELVLAIHDASSIEDVQTLIIETKKDIKPTRHNSMQSHLDKCLLIIEMVSNEGVKAPALVSKMSY